MFGNVKEFGKNGKNIFAECIIEAIKNKYKIRTKKTMTIHNGPFQMGFSKDFIKGRFGWPEVKRAIRNDEFVIERIDIKIVDKTGDELKLILDKGIPTEVTKEVILKNL